MWTRAFVALALLSLGGCVVGPKYHQPVTPTPPQFKEGGTPDSGTPDIAYSDWWRGFNDPELSRLETEADAANQDAKLSMGRGEKADPGPKIPPSSPFPTFHLRTTAPPPPQTPPPPRPHPP